ncbi:ATP-binding protein [Dactylosporangium sp. NPDC051485]|uniref:ATP-binding protein n=1 Tax=Dactylosporangium sp. NPDC051485 TaxID=3154846 RepID=UPI00342A86DB
MHELHDDQHVPVTVTAVAVTGDTARLVVIHASAAGTAAAGAPVVAITGLDPDDTRATLDRVRAAVTFTGLRWPSRPVTVEVGPATPTVPDAGLDVAVAVAILAASGQVPTGAARAVLVGELGLDGGLRTPRHVTERLTAAAAAGAALVIAPAGACAIAASVPGITVWYAHHLRELVDELYAAAAHDTATATGPARPGGAGWPSPGVPVADLAEIPAEHLGRRLVEVAAAGGHRLAMIGTPSATTAVARCLPGLLPDLDDDTSRQVADLYRAAGLVPAQVAAMRRPPWQAPHHTSSTPALIGTRRKPGAVSLALAGILFLADAAEFRSHTLEALSAPLDTEWIRFAGPDGPVAYPARAQLVVTTSGCPCDDLDGCTCTPVRRRRYLQRLQPLLTRVAIRAVVPPMSPPGPVSGESSVVVAARVAAARAAARARWAPHVTATNHDVPHAVLQHGSTRIRPVDLAQLRNAIDTGTVSYRTAGHVLRLAWTLADLAGRDLPSDDHVAEALILTAGARY